MSRDVGKAHSPTFPSLHLCQLILQPFRRFTYVTAHSPTLPFLHLRHSSFSNPSFASPTSQALHLIHLARRPWETVRRDCMGILLLFSPFTKPLPPVSLLGVQSCLDRGALDILTKGKEFTNIDNFVLFREEEFRYCYYTESKNLSQYIFSQ